MKIDRQTLKMAIQGFDQQIAELQAKRAQAFRALQPRLFAEAIGMKITEHKPRQLSRGARNRIAIAQRKRWAEYRKKEAQKILRGARRTFRKKLAQ